jgi:hypothetical protein
MRALKAALIGVIVGWAWHWYSSHEVSIRIKPLVEVERQTLQMPPLAITAAIDKPKRKLKTAIEVKEPTEEQMVSLGFKKVEEQ